MKSRATVVRTQRTQRGSVVVIFSSLALLGGAVILYSATSTTRAIATMVMRCAQMGSRLGNSA